MSDLKLDFPGLLKEKMKSGNVRYRVRLEGNPRKRVNLLVTPDHPDFQEFYLAARRGIQLKPESTPVERSVRGSIAWLIYKYMEHLEGRVHAGLSSPMTLKKKGLLLKKLRGTCGEYSSDIPTSEVIKIRDAMKDTPAFADSMVEAIRVMYRWAVERGICDVNPAIGVSKIDKGNGGAIPWTQDDLRQYKKFHPFGTNAYLCLTLFMFTACRIGDALFLGRNNEFERHGIRGIGWQPSKKGSAYVKIPMLPPLYKATRAMKVQGDRYLLTGDGQPFRSPDALGQRFRKWCREAGLENRSSHGIRKAAGHLLAQEGCTQYQIMCIHGHTEAKTSEVYTKGIERWKMAADAMQTFRKIEW